MTKAEIDRVVKIATTYKKAGPVPRLLGELQRVGQPDGLEGGRGRVDVVAGRGAARRAGHQRQVRGSADGLPRLVQRPGHRVARRERSRQAAGLLRLPELDVQRAGSAPTIMRQGYYIGNGSTLLQLDQVRTPAEPAGGIPFKADEYAFWYGGKPAAPRPAGHHRQGRRHQEGLGARRRLVRPAHRPLLVLELATSRTACTRSSGGTTSSAPRTAWLRRS